MGHKTSVYLRDDVAEAWRASGVPLAEVIRRGLAAGDPDEARLRLVAAEAVRGAHDDAQESLGEIVERAVRSALRDAQGGHL